MILKKTSCAHNEDELGLSGQQKGGARGSGMGRGARHPAAGGSGQRPRRGAPTAPPPFSSGPGASPRGGEPPALPLPPRPAPPAGRAGGAWPCLSRRPRPAPAPAARFSPSCCKHHRRENSTVSDNCWHHPPMSHKNGQHIK